MKELIKQKTESVLEDVIKVRRELHMYPEIGHNEKETSKRIKAELDKLQLDEIRTGIGGYGVVGILKGEKGDGKTILLRADMDALPMQEKTNLEFASKNDGAMHACGHDTHMSILLGAAKVLTQMKDKFKGNIVFCFQPAEEANPEGGAQGMIDDGVLDDPKVDAAYALHVWNEPVGTIAYRDGAMMAQSDRIFITVKGTASHGSQPEKGKDAILASAHIITALQSIVSRNTSPFLPLVVSIGVIQGGDRYNIICDEVNLQGTVRSYDPKLAKEMPERIEKIAKDVANAFGCEAEIKYVSGYRSVVNDHELFEIANEAFEEQFGSERISHPEVPNTGGEDFSAFGDYVPILYAWLGIESEKNSGPNQTTLHNPNLIVDEDAIPMGIESMVSFALKYLEK